MEGNYRSATFHLSGFLKIMKDNSGKALILIPGTNAFNDQPNQPA
jgi:hypothetical protein